MFPRAMLIFAMVTVFLFGIIMGYVFTRPNPESKNEEPYEQYHFYRMLDICDAYYRNYDKGERLMDRIFSEEILLRTLFRAIIDDDVKRVQRILNDSIIDLNKKLPFSDETLFAELLMFGWDRWDNDEILEVLYQHDMNLPAQPFVTQPFANKKATTIAAMHGKIKTLRWLQRHGAPMPFGDDIKEIGQSLELGIPCDPKSGLGARSYDDKLILEIMECIQPKPKPSGIAP